MNKILAYKISVFSVLLSSFTMHGNWFKQTVKYSTDTINTSATVSKNVGDGSAFEGSPNEMANGTAFTDRNSSGTPSQKSVPSTCPQGIIDDFTKNITTQDQFDARKKQFEQIVKDAQAAVDSAANNRKKANKAGNSAKINEWKKKENDRKNQLKHKIKEFTCFKEWAPSFKPAA